MSDPYAWVSTHAELYDQQVRMMSHTHARQTLALKTTQAAQRLALARNYNMPGDFQRWTRILRQLRAEADREFFGQVVNTSTEDQD